MATLTPTERTTQETTTRVKHPLDAVRSHIRRYVLLETAAAILFFVALYFWIGLFIDFGAFWSLAYDWMLELNFLDTGGHASRGIRIGVLALVAGGLGYVLFTRLFVRFWREFNDPAVALVLERRFPKELGDRLITAVELSDPKKAESYGFSREMLAKTVNEAAERVEKLPVHEVFDWARLRRQWWRAIGVTLGLFVAVMLMCLGVQAARGRDTQPVGNLWSFKDVASIWVERNILLQDSYWLRNAQLEIVRFQDKGHPGEMRVGRDESRPDLIVRAVSWVVPDAKAIGGWRALRVAEVGDYVPSDMVSAIGIPEDWSGWTIDLDDLDASIPTGTAPLAWQGKTSGDVAKALAADQALAANLEKIGADKAVKGLGNWKTWSFDKLLQQANDPKVQARLSEEFPNALSAIHNLQSQLEEQAASPRMNRRLRKLETPSEVFITFRGASTKATSQGDVVSDRKFSFGLADLKESVSFYVRGGDYFTPPLKITLAPPPAIREISVDKQEPAYLYYWLPGSQAPLKGKKQIFTASKVSVTGETSVIDVPLGTNLVLKAQVDRPLKEGIRIRAPGQARDPGTVVPDNLVTRDADGNGFSVSFDKVEKTMDFLFEFFDEDNVKGKRRVRIRPIDDLAPEILNFELDVVLRKPRFKEGLSKSLGGATTEALLITPDALLPFGGTVRDDVALTDVRWVFDTTPIVIETGVGKDPGRVILQGTPTLRRTSLVVSTLQFSPFSQAQILAAPSYLNLMAKVIDADLKRKQIDTEKSAPLTMFVEDLKAKEETPLAEIDAKLKEKPGKKPFLKEHVLKRRSGDQEFFNVKQHLPDLVMKDAASQGQIFHSMKLSVAATDNNVETGPSTSKTRAPIVFLVVPETELLAQIGLEEEVLRERLEKTIAKLKTAQTTMSAQTPILRSANPETDYSLVALRVDEVRKALLDSASTTREIHADYSRILQELIVNRVKKDKISDVQTKIVQPLDLIINPSFGDYALTEDVLGRLSQQLEDDVAAKRIAQTLPKLLEHSTQTEDQLATLIEKLNAILLSIDRGIDFNSILQIVVSIERDHNQVIQPLRVHHDKVLGDIFKELTEK